MKYLCIDYGLVRTGIAISDTDASMAFPLCTITLPAQQKKEVFWQKLLHVLTEQAPAALVVGLPLLPDNSESTTTRQVRNFVASLKRRTSLPVYMMPELLSSFQADDDLQHAHMTRKQKQAVSDQQAAVRILESFLADPAPQTRLV